jgi:hypothetical protein
MWVEVGDGTKNANSSLQIVNEIIKDFTAENVLCGKK